MAGTGNDYIGRVNVTRSNRTCQVWSTQNPKQNQTIVSNNTILGTTKTSKTHNATNSSKIIARGIQKHRVDPEFLNGSLYADMSAESALNFCRNPSRSIAGEI